MNRFKISVLIFGLLAVLAFAGAAEAKLNVVTTIPDLAVVVSEVGGDNVSVQSISKGTQDPHFIEAKPSYMVKVSHADLVVSLGLELEIGWLPPILQGARNPNVMPGTKGYLELGPFVDPIEVPKEKVTRVEGDVHPFGNPHFNLDPIRMERSPRSSPTVWANLILNTPPLIRRMPKSFSTGWRRKPKAGRRASIRPE